MLSQKMNWNPKGIIQQEIAFGKKELESEIKLYTEVIYILIGIGVLLLFILVIYKVAKRFGRADLGTEIDEMEGADFEQFCGELLKKHGFIEVEVTKASGDFGVDILAEKDGVTYAIQCKRYAEPVGVKAIQEICAGRDYYDRMVGAVLTNQYFTAPAVDAAKKLKILLWDRGYLDSMLDEEEEHV